MFTTTVQMLKLSKILILIQSGNLLTYEVWYGEPSSDILSTPYLIRLAVVQLLR